MKTSGDFLTAYNMLREEVRRAQWSAVDLETGASCPFCGGEPYGEEDWPFGHNNECVVAELELAERCDP